MRGFKPTFKGKNMTNGNNNNRLDRIEALLEHFVVVSDERMTRSEQSMLQSDQRLTRIEQSMLQSDQRLTRIEQIVDSNNRFLESFSRNLQQYSTSMDNFAKRIDGVIATNNEQRDETNLRLASIQRQVGAISQHLGLNQ